MLNGKCQLYYLLVDVLKEKIRNTIISGIFIVLLWVFFFVSFFAIFRIQNFLEKGGRITTGIIFPFLSFLVYLLCFFWFYSRTAKACPNYRKFFALSLIFAFLGEISMGINEKVEVAMSGNYLEYLAPIFGYLILGTTAFYLNLWVKNKRIFYLLMFIIGVYLIEVLFLKNVDIGIPSLFMILASSFYWALSVYPRYFTDPGISWNLKRKRLILIGALAFISLFVIAPIMMYGFDLRHPDLAEYGVTFAPLHIFSMGIGVIFYALLFLVDFLPDIIKANYFLREK